MSKREMAGLTARTWVVALSTLCMASLFGPARAEACSCAENPPCAAAWTADSVFIGTMVDRSLERIGGSINWTVHRVLVTQVLVGSVGAHVTLIPNFRPTQQQIAESQGRPESTISSSCDYPFQPGRQYLIYAHRTADQRWTTSVCAGTKPIEAAGDDLKYFAGLAGSEPLGHVYGTVKKTVPNAPGGATAEIVPAAGVKIGLAGETTRFSATTDAEGKLDVQVPPGDYVISADVPPTVHVYGAPVRVRIPAHGCVPLSLSLQADGRIAGRVVHEDGTAVAGAFVDVIPASLPEGRRLDSLMVQSGTSDEAGRFAVSRVLPGRYVIAVNARFGPRLSSPYVATYFPGTSRQNAQTIDIGEGERKTGFTIVVTSLAETTVTGMVFRDSDRPLANADVTATLIDHKGTIMSSSRTDAGGGFQLHVLTGVTYVIRAGIRTPEGYRQSEIIILVDGQKDDIRLSIPQ